MRILDSMNGAQPLTRATRMHLFQRLGDRVERLADQNRIFCESTIGQRYQQNANQLREMVFADRISLESRDGIYPTVRNVVQRRCKMLGVDVSAMGTQIQGGVQSICDSTHDW